MTIMTKHGNANSLPESLHLNHRPLSLDIKLRAESIIYNRSIDSTTRWIIRYCLEINDPCTPDFVRRVEAGENIADSLDFTTTESSQR
jgi:hypothetical protein